MKDRLLVQLSLADPDDTITIKQRKSIGLWEITKAIVATYPKRRGVTPPALNGDAAVRVAR